MACVKLKWHTFRVRHGTAVFEHDTYTLKPITGATVTLGTAGVRTNQFANLTIQDEGRLVLESGYGDIGDIWTLEVCLFASCFISGR